MISKHLKRFAFGLVLAAFSSSATAQDLLASQAPIDRRLKAVDSVSLQRLVEKESFEAPSNDIYNSWNTTHVFCYSDKDIPSTYKIDCRDFSMPTKSRQVTSHVGYRPRFKRMHKGTDIKLYTGDTVYAAFSGKVRVSTYQASGYGNVIVIRHNNGLETIYGHLSKRFFKPGDVVKSGQPIGLGGNTGRSFGSHLHFETRIAGGLIDPEEIFDFANQDVKCDFYTFRKHGRNSRSSKSTLAKKTTREEPIAARSTDTDDEALPATAASGNSYTVRAGETIASIARKLNVSVARLEEANRLPRNQKLRDGQILVY